MRSLESSQPEHRFGDCLNDGVSHQVYAIVQPAFTSTSQLDYMLILDQRGHPPERVDGGLVRVALQALLKCFCHVQIAPSLNIRRPPAVAKSDVEGHLENRSGCFLGRTPASGASRHLNARTTVHYCLS